MATNLKTAAAGPAADTTLERRALAWMNDPYEAVAHSNTQMQIGRASCRERV